MPCPYWWSEDHSHGVALWNKSGEWNALVTLSKSLPFSTSKYPLPLTLSLCICCVYVSIICILVYLRQIFQIHWQHLAFNYFPSWRSPFQQETLTFQFLTLLTCRSLLVFTCFFCSIHPGWRAPCNINHIAIFAPGTFERAVWLLLKHFRASKKALPLSTPNPRFYWGINKRWYGKGNLFLAPSKSVFKARFLALLEVKCPQHLQALDLIKSTNPFPIQTPVSFELLSLGAESWGVLHLHTHISGPWIWKPYFLSAYANMADADLSKNDKSLLE